jgi:Fe-S cluster assembly iron-binding protein IscA
LALALDEPNDNDEVVDSNGFKFVMDKKLLEMAKPVKVDVTYMGFTVDSNLQLGGGSCGTSGCAPGACG